MNVHIYWEPKQPLTRYRIPETVLETPKDEEPVWIEHDPDELWMCQNCYRDRPASELNVQVYYDCSVITCREKEYGRSPEFPFEYGYVCKGAAFQSKRSRGLK